MRRRTLAARVTAAAAAIAVLVALLVAAALVAILALRKAESREARASEVAVAALRLRSTAADEESALRGYALTTNQRFLVLFRAAHARVPGQVNRLRAAVEDPAQRRRVDEAAQELQAYYRDFAQNIVVIGQVAPSVVRGRAATSEDRRRSAGIRATIDAILSAESSRAAAASRHARAVARIATVVGVLAVLVSAALVLVFGVWVARAVARPLRRVAAAAADVAAGDLSVRLPERGAGEAGALVSAFNSMTRSLETSQRELTAQNEQLVESERHKRELVSMVSHEIRTPLAAVIGFTRLLLDRDFPADEQRRYLEIVDGQARRLAALAGDFLDVQLLDSGSMSLVPTRFDLADLVREQVQLFFLEPTTHRLELELPSTRVPVDADRDRIAQVVGNLLSNALKYSGDETTVRVAVEPGENEVTVLVADEGAGIAPEDRDRVFDRFFRTAQAASTVGGTGLGLALAREIVEAHGGRIDLESEVGVGSTFRVSLPRIASDLDAQTELETGAPPARV